MTRSKRERKRDPRISTVQWIKECLHPHAKAEKVVESLEGDVDDNLGKKRAVDVSPINIICFDGGGMKSLAHMVMCGEILKRGRGKNLLGYFDLAAGTSAGGVAALLCNTCDGDGELSIQEGLRYIDGITAKSKFSLWQLLTRGSATDSVWMHNQDFVGLDAPLYNPDSMKAFAVASLRVDQEENGTKSSSFEPFLMRTYDAWSETRQCDDDDDENEEKQEEPTTTPKKPTSSFLPGTSDIKLWEAMTATSAAPVATDRINVDIDGQEHRFGDGAAVSNCPVAIAIHEARNLWPNRPLGVVLSLGLSKAEDALIDRAIEASRQKDPDLHFLRLYPPFQGFSSSQMRKKPQEKLKERVRTYMRETKVEEVDEMITYLELHERASFPRTPSSKRRRISTSTRLSLLRHSVGNGSEEEKMLMQRLSLLAIQEKRKSTS